MNKIIVIISSRCIQRRKRMRWAGFPWGYRNWLDFLNSPFPSRLLQLINSILCNTFMQESAIFSSSSGIAIIIIIFSRSRSFCSQPFLRWGDDKSGRERDLTLIWLIPLQFWILQFIPLWLSFSVNSLLHWRFALHFFCSVHFDWLESCWLPSSRWISPTDRLLLKSSRLNPNSYLSLSP